MNVLIEKYLTKQMIGRILLIVCPVLVQLFSFQYTDSKIPLVLLGAYLPLVFSEKRFEVKNTLYYFIIGCSLLVKITSLFIGIVFVMLSRNNSNYNSSYNFTLGIVFILLALISNIRISYSITGIMLINTLTYFAFNSNYLFFASGFMIFIMVEFFTGTQLQLLAPFSKKRYNLEFEEINKSRKMACILITTFSIIFCIIVISFFEPFNTSYHKYNNTQIQTNTDSGIKF